MYPKKIILLAVLFALSCIMGSKHLLWKNYPRQDLGQTNLKPLRSFNGNDCHCRSLFSVGSCGMKTLLTLESAIPNIKTIASDLLSFSFDKAFKRLSSYLKYRYTFSKLHLGSNNKTSMDLSDVGSMTDISFPYIPCQLHLYSPSEVTTCANQYKLAINEPIRIAYVGDSTVRNFVESLVIFLGKVLHRESLELSNLDNQINKILKGKVKHNVTLMGNNIELTFLWAPSMRTNISVFTQYKQSIKETDRILSKWAASDSTRVPKYIVIGYGTWQATLTSHVEGLSKYISGTRKMQVVFERLAKKSIVLWHIVPAAKNWKVKHFRPQGVLEFMNQVRGRRSAGSSIWMWNTLQPVIYKEIQECKIFQELNMLRFIPDSWKCSDYVHAGIRTVGTGNNMLLNLICNHYLNLTVNFCCAQV